jgi:hypothetical protein
LAIVVPLLAILVALVYARRDLGSRNARVTGGIIAGVTLLLSIPAAAALPRYDGDGLWVLYVWYGTVLIPIAATTIAPRPIHPACSSTTLLGAIAARIAIPTTMAKK